MKVQQTIALDKREQKTLSRKTKKIKKKVKSGKIIIREEMKEKVLQGEQLRGLIYIGHLPHGFYETEIREYFSQFGKVTNAKVCRSKKNGNSKGYGYVEFAHPDVAKIAAESMNNYLMFKKKVIAEFVPNDKRPRHIFHGKQSTPQNCSGQKRRIRNAVTKNAVIDEDEHLRQSSLRLTRLQKRMEKIRSYGIDYNLKPVDVPAGLKLK